MRIVSRRSLILTLSLAILICGSLLTGCVSGRFEPSGWDGITLSDDTLYACSDGKFLALNLSEKTIRDFTPVDEDSGSSSLFGCGGSSAPQLTSFAAPVVSGSLLYASTYIGEVYALDTMRNLPPISTACPRETITSLCLARALKASRTPEALLFTTRASSAPVS